MAKDKGKKPGNPTSKKYKMYKIDGDHIIRERNCPRCGPGVFLMNPGNRLYCGKCHYTEFKKEAK